MVQLNLALREINCKVVYFGCGLGGKTTNLEIVHKKAAPDSRGELTSIATESDRTLFFDFMPLDLGEVSGMRVKFQLYTVPGQVYYNSTRKLVLRGADGVIFVADSQASKLDENIESIDNLEECLQEQGRSLDEMPHVIQFNKRDLDDILTVEELEKQLNRYGAPCTEAMAASGEGVLETFKALAAMMLDKVKAMSTESSTKPSVSKSPGIGKAKVQPNPLTDSHKLQGGIASTPEKAQPLVNLSNTPINTLPKEPARPAGFESTSFSQPSSPAATRPAASLPPSEPVGRAPAPAPQASAAPQASIPAELPQALAPTLSPVPSPAPVAAPAMETVVPEAAVATLATVKPSIREPRSEKTPRRVRPGMTAGAMQIMGEGMMISSSSRRRGGDGKVFWALGLLVLGAAAAAGWYYFLR